MNKILIFIIAVLLQEWFAYFLFRYIRNYFDKRHQHNVKGNRLSAVKGILERFVIIISLYNEMPHILSVFAALKIGTRLKEDQENRISNDYFLIGNLVSLLLVIVTFLLTERFN